MQDLPLTLFLCTGNACRSQMAEGWARHLFPEGVFLSAGIKKHGLNPHAVAVMAERGVDIAYHWSKTLEELPELERIELVITVCDSARGSCPVFPGPARVIHRGFDDPPALAAKLVDPQQQLNAYRRVRDQIGQFIREEWLALTEV